ncbi:hypothetical protein JCM8097_005586 [Rhodosporidiobolus ruineniae]
MSRPPPLLLNGSTAPPLALQQELAQLHQQLDEALNVANGARAALDRLQHDGEEAADELEGALADELAKAEDAIPRLEQRIRYAELELASAIPAPPSAPYANGFSPVVSPVPTSYLSSDASAYLPSPALPLPEPTFQASFEQVVDLLSRLGEMDSVGERVRAMDTVVEIVERQVEVKYELRLEEFLPSITACLSDSAGKEVRASVYRLLRHLVVDLTDISHLNEHHVPLFLVRSLARDSAHLLEKEHALRLIRALLPFSSPDLLDVVPVSAMRAVVAIAETVEEKLRLAALEMLGEMVILNLPLLSASGGLRLILQTLTDGPSDLSLPLSLLFLHAMDHPASRQYLRPGIDLEVVLAGFTEVQPKGAGGEERVRTCAGIVGSWLKSWSGLFYLNIHGRQALTSLVDSLTNPSQAIRETLLDTLFSVFNVKTPAWYASRDTRSSFSAASGEVFDLPSALAAAHTTSRRTNLLDQYTAILLLVFIEAGLVEALASLAADPKDPVTAQKVSLLIAEVLALGNRVLPPQHAVRLQALPKLFALTSSFDASPARLAASDALLSVAAHTRDRRHRELTRLTAAAADEKTRPRSNSLEESIARARSGSNSMSMSTSAASKATNSQAAQVASTKLLSALKMDDASFRALLLSTNVLSTKDHSKWNLDALVEVTEGPLRNRARQEEALRASKWGRRVLGFFAPVGGGYAGMRKDAPAAAKWTRLGCSLLSTLLANPDGVAYLAEDKTLRSISDALFQLEPQLASSNNIAPEQVFARDRMETTVVSGYFEMLGVLSSSSEGIRLLDQLRIWTAFYRISELRNRDDLVKLIIENMDYSFDGHARVFLAKALTSSYKHIRLFATSHLAHLLHSSTRSGSSPCPLSSTWQVALLVQQLYDSAPEVVHLAVRVLEDACAVEETLEMVVGMRPALDLLGEVGEGLLTRFLSLESGVQYLHEIDFIDRELDTWFNERNVLYVVELELALASVLQTDGGLDDSPSTFDGTPPSHFYGELVKTSEGCAILLDSGHLEHFVEIVQSHAESDLDEADVLTLKSVLWTMGHIGSTADGLALLDDEGVLADLVQIAAFSPVYSLRGTATYALALISQTEEGTEMLDELGWESVYTPICGPTGICVPMYLGDYIFTPLWDPPLLSLPSSLTLAPSTSHLEREALLALSNLSNHILATKASKTLSRLKTRHPELFSPSSASISSSPSPPDPAYTLFYRALDMLGSHHYRLAVRKYVLELFDVPLDPASAARIAEAGEALRAAKAAADEGGGGTGYEGEEVNGMRAPLGGGLRPTWARSGATVGSVLNGGRRVRGGVDGEEDEGEEEDDDDASTVDEEAALAVPLAVRAPVLTVKGFLLS